MNIIYYNESSVFDELSYDKGCLIAIDSNLVSTHQVELPKMSLSKAKKAIPFLLEPVLLSDIENLDFLVQKTTDELYYNVIVIDKQVMVELQEKIEQAPQLEIDRCVIDFMLLPNEQGKMHYLEDEKGVLFRFGEFLGGRMEKTMFDTSISMGEYQPIPASLDVKNLRQINLLDANWLKNWEKTLRQWRIGIAVILLLVVLAPIQLIVDNYYLAEHLQQQQNANQQTFKRLFPSVKRIVDLPVQIQQKLNQSNSYQAKSNDDLLTKLTAKPSPKTAIEHLKFKQQTLTLQ